MAGTYFVGVDIGTQGTKAALYSDQGVLSAEAFCSSRLRRPEPGTVEEDPEDQFSSVCTTIKKCLDQSRIAPESVASVAVDGQMAGTIGIGADALPVTPYDSWLDTRCTPWIRAMKLQAGEEILRKTGNAPSFNQGPKVLYWKEKFPETYRRIRAFVQPGGYASMRLCGLGIDHAYVDHTYLHFSGFADNAAERWDSGLCAEFAVDATKFPRIAKPTELIGRISREGSRLSGLAEGTPVAAGLGDTAASFLSCGATEEGVCVDVAGTASVFAATSAAFAPDLVSGIMGIGRSAVPGLWHPYAYINGGGMNMLWFAGKIAAGTGAAREEVDFGSLDALVRDLEPRKDDPWFLPHMEGRTMPSDPWMRGAWAGLRWDHGIDRLYRAVLEGVGFEYALYLEAIRRLYPSMALKEVRMTGGGAKSAVWTATKADILGLPFREVQGSGGAPQGAAILAAASVSGGKGPAELASEWLRLGAAALPRPERKSLYARRLGSYKRLLEALSGFPGEEEDQ